MHMWDDWLPVPLSPGAVNHVELGTVELVENNSAIKNMSF